jgi:hypothetical protein
MINYCHDKFFHSSYGKFIISFQIFMYDPLFYI